MQQRKDSLKQIVLDRTSQYLTGRKRTSSPHTVHKNSKWLRDLNIKKIYKLLEKQHEKKLCNFGVGKNFLDRTGQVFLITKMKFNK